MAQSVKEAYRRNKEDGQVVNVCTQKGCFEVQVFGVPGDNDLERGIRSMTRSLP